MKQPHRILEEPVEFNKEFIDLRADDKVYLQSHSHLLKVNIEFGILAIIVCIWPMIIAKSNQQRILPIILILGGLFWIIYGLYTKKNYKIFELNRLSGTVTYPDSYFRKPLKGKFKALHAVIAVTGNIDGYVDSEYLKFVNTFKPRKLTLLYTFYGREPYKDWSFYVWYMDKNRPLPPGTAFDPYREQDFERRKKLGFPRPLYGSNIDTPEATEQQQAERERIGGW